MKTKSRRLVGVLSVLATASAVSSTFAGTVDVAATAAIPTEPAVNQRTAGLTPRLSGPACPDPVERPRPELVGGAAPTSGTDNDLNDQGTSDPDPSNSGHILDLGRHPSFAWLGSAVTTSWPEVNSPARSDPTSVPARTGQDDALALALPDALRMFPLGAVVAALAIRRMRRVSSR